MKKILFSILIIVLCATIAVAGSIYYIVKSTTPTKVITGRARITKITYGNPAGSANSISFYDHSVTTTSYTDCGPIFRMEAPANDMNDMVLDMWTTIDFAVAISTGDLAGSISTNTTSWIIINYR